MENTQNMPDDAAPSSSVEDTAEGLLVSDAAPDAGSELEPAPQASRKKKAKVKFESVMQRGEAVAYFSALVDGMRHGRLLFKQREETLSLAPPAQVLVEVKATQKGDKEKVSFELSWRTGDVAELEVSG